MSFRKHGLKALGLGIMAALSLMALSASAQAAAFLENGSAITTLLTANGEVDVLGKLQVEALNVEIDCSGFSVQEGDLLGSGAGETAGVGHAKLLFEGCKGYVLSPLAEQGGCKLFPTAADRTAGTNEGKILASGLAEVFLHSDGKAYVKITGTGAEKLFSTILSTGCIGIPNGIKVKGSVVIKATPGEENVEKQLGEMASLALFPNELKYGENPAEILGSVWVKLSNNKPWGIC